jgi:hypothetical protein
MVYHGRVLKGVVVFEEQAPPPDGTRVRVETESRGVAAETRPTGIARRMRGFLKTSAPMPDDEQIDRLRFEALAEKYGLDADPPGHQRRP